MKVTTKKLENSQVEIKGTLTFAEWSSHIDHVVEHLADRTKIPGFRGGKVPASMVEKHFGREAILHETAEHALEHEWPKILAEVKGIELIGQPAINIEKVADGEDLEFTVVTDCMPEVDLGKWRSRIDKELKNVKPAAEVSDAEVEEEVKRIADMRGSYAAVDREAKNGDEVTIDFLVTVDGVVIEGGTGHDHHLVLGSNTFIPGFEEGVVGMKKGDEKTLALAFPQGYHAEHLSGKPANFKVTVNQVAEKQAVEINDEFAKTLGKFENVAELKTKIREGIAEEAKGKAKEDLRGTLVNALVEGVDANVPASLMLGEKSRMLAQFQEQISMMGMSWEQYLVNTKKTEDELMGEWDDSAKKRVIVELALAHVAKEMEIIVDSETIEAEMNQTLQYFKSIEKAQKDINLQALYGAVKERLTQQKTLEYLESIKA